MKQNSKTSANIPNLQFENIKEEEEEGKLEYLSKDCQINLNAENMDECAAQLFEMKNNQQILPYEQKK